MPISYILERTKLRKNSAPVNKTEYINLLISHTEPATKHCLTNAADPVFNI
jgi:hypothetical protein